MYEWKGRRRKRRSSRRSRRSKRNRRCRRKIRTYIILRYVKEQAGFLEARPPPSDLGNYSVNTGAASLSTSWCEWVISVTFCLVGFNFVCQGSVRTLGCDCFAPAPTDGRDPSEVWQWLPPGTGWIGMSYILLQNHFASQNSDPSHFLIRLSALSTIYTHESQVHRWFQSNLQWLRKRLLQEASIWAHCIFLVGPTVTWP